MKIKMFGAGKSAELIIRYLNEDCYEEYDFEIYDDIVTDNIMGYPISGKLSDADIRKGDHVIISIGLAMWLRRELFNRYKSKAVFVNVNRSDIDATAIGHGNIIFPDVSFDYASTIGDNNVISAGTVITHHCHIGDSNLFGPGCLLSGSVIIGNNCTFGAGVIFQPGVKIADGITIPSGVVIVGNINHPVKAQRDGGILTGQYRNVYRGYDR